MIKKHLRIMTVYVTCLLKCLRVSNILLIKYHILVYSYRHLLCTLVCQSGHNVTLQFYGQPPGDRRRKITELRER
jgi:hypothetical protein